MKIRRGSDMKRHLNEIRKKGWPVKASALAAFSLLILSCSRADTGEYSVMKGVFRQSVMETGELQAVSAYSLFLPRINYMYGSTFKIIGLTEHGTSVNGGDTVVTLDPSTVQKTILDRQEMLENEIAAMNKLKAQLVNNMQDLRSQFTTEQSSYDLKRLSFEKSGFESAGMRRVSELEFRQAGVKLNRIKRKLELRPVLDSLDLLIQNIKVIQRENDLKSAMETLNMLTVVSPIDGIFVIETNRRTAQMIKVGDDINLMYPVAMIPDVRTMKVKGSVQELDVSRIKTDQNVIVRLDALPSVDFSGRVTYIGKICVEAGDRRVFNTEVLISESDVRLKPGMTVSCEYITYEGKGDDLYVPTSCLQSEGGKSYLFVMRRGRVEKREVTTGLSNNTYTIVKGDVRQGLPLVLPETIMNR
ncbi:MAG: efflux RND transporter periplasmic adaptor subunit [Bacteroidales bacterium]